eukprot:1805671-Rhodomonas_salina.1
MPPLLRRPAACLPRSRPPRADALSPPLAGPTQLPRSRALCLLRRLQWAVGAARRRSRRTRSRLPAPPHPKSALRIARCGELPGRDQAAAPHSPRQLRALHAARVAGQLGAEPTPGRHVACKGFSPADPLAARAPRVPRMHLDQHLPARDRPDFTATEASGPCRAGREGGRWGVLDERGLGGVVEEEGEGVQFAAFAVHLKHSDRPAQDPHTIRRACASHRRRLAPQLESSLPWQHSAK